MKRSYTYILFFIFCFISCINYAQNTDSLKLALKQAKQDTTRLKLLLQLSEVCEYEEILNYTRPAIILADKLLEQSFNDKEKARILSQKATAIYNTGFFYEQQNNFALTLEFYLKSLKIREGLDGNERDLGGNYNSLGFLYSNQGDITKALDFYSRSLSLARKINDKEGIAVTLNNFGFVYQNLGDDQKALEYYNQSLKLQETLNNKYAAATTLNNIGTIYFNMHKSREAIEIYLKSLKIRQEINDESGICSSLYNLGSIYMLQGKTTEALNYYQQSLSIGKKVNNLTGITISFNSIGTIYLNQAALKKNGEKNKLLLLARMAVDSSLAKSKQLGFPEQIRLAEHTAARVDSAMGNYRSAFDHYKNYIIYTDSINNEVTRKASVKSQLNHEFEKKEAVIKEQQEKERAIANGKDRFQQTIIWAVIVGLLFVVIFAVFILRSLKVTKHQKYIIEEKQKEILDSIRYAKRIQTSLLPTEKYIEKHLMP